MNVLLIIPKRDSYTILPAPDIGIAYIARAALNSGAEVDILDAHKENIEPERISNYLKNKAYNLVGIKCLSIDYFKVLKYCQEIKRYDSRIITVLGGYHPSVLPQDVMKCGDIDYIVKGEGERAVSCLIKIFIEHNGDMPLDKVKDIPSLVYRSGKDRGGIVSNLVRFEEDLDSIGFPAWHLFKTDEYPKLPGSGGRFLPVITSRGCPSMCAFCCSFSIHGKKVRTRSPENVIEEIRWLIGNFNIQKVSIYDDNFAFYKDHAMSICALYAENNFKTNFDIPQGIRIDRLDKDLIIALDHSGCGYIGIGIESGDDKTLNIIKKGTTTSEIEEKINLLRMYSRIKLMGFFIIGFPHETEESILKTINYSLKLKLDYAAFTIFTPFPGTELFSQMLKEGYFSLNSFNWESLLLDRESFRHRNISIDKLKKLQRLAYIKFYLRPSKINFFLRIIKEASFFSYLRRFISICKK